MSESIKFSKDAVEIAAVDPISHLVNSLLNHDNRGSPQQHQQQPSPRKSTKDYFATLAKAAELANKKLVEQNRPMRFCVYQKEGRVFIDIVELNPNGSRKSLYTKEITNEDFSDMIEDVANAEGLMFDKKG